MSKLIIIRGNSGCGKTTTAKRLRDELGRQTVLVSQDMVRREILWVQDTAGNLSIDLIYEICMFGSRHDRTVILEGILSRKKYGQMLEKLRADFDGEVKAFYMDVPFEETLRRHATKPNAHEFGEAEMRQWWKDKDYLGWDCEVILPGELEQDETVKTIIKHLAK